MTAQEQQEKAWEGGELLVAAVVQLLLVTLAYRIDRQKSAPLFSTSSLAIFCGLGCGALMAFLSRSRVHGVGLNPQTLFFGLLPPIILEAGFNTQRKGFFSNFWTITLLAVAGTLIATFVTGGLLVCLGRLGLITQLTSAEALLYGSLISATDPVATLLVFQKSKAPSLLFNLVFGESVINDAVAIVVFSLFQQFVQSGNSEVTLKIAGGMALQFVSIGIGSVLLAGLICFCSAYFLKNADPALKRHPTYEISIVLLSAYSSYVAADVCQLSGLLAVFFSGVFIRHYHMYNISKASSFAFKHMLSTLSFLAENFIYLYLGISLIAYSDSFLWDWGFIWASLAVLLVARACNTFPLCALANASRPSAQRIPGNYMVVIWFAGLRGAIAFALALNVQTTDPSHAAVIKSATLFTVLFTTVVMSMGTSPMLECFGLAYSTREAKPQLMVPANGLDHTKSGERTLLLPMPTPRHVNRTKTHSAWVDLDEKYLKPLFGGNPRGRSESTLSHIYRQYESME